LIASNLPINQKNKLSHKFQSHQNHFLSHHSTKKAIQNVSYFLPAIITLVQNLPHIVCTAWVVAWWELPVTQEIRSSGIGCLPSQPSPPEK
jgi:hypothetical protein